MAPVVTTGVSNEGKNSLTRHPHAEGHANLSVSFHGRSSNCACHPCAEAMQIFQPIPTFLELCVSAMHRSHANTLQILDVPSKQEACCSSSKKKYVRVILAQRAMQIFSAQKKKKRATDPCRRENRHSCAGSPIISSAFRGRLFRGIRTFGRAVEGSSVSPLTNTMGGRPLRLWTRGDTSRVCSAPSFVIARLRAQALALDLACGTCCPPCVIRKAYTIEGSSNTGRKSSSMR